MSWNDGTDPLFFDAVGGDIMQVDASQDPQQGSGTSEYATRIDSAADEPTAAPRAV